jgi:2-polyprenyl-6-methoxyphenol hydroxylase-like FAD-dependent oxidoreductase
MRALPVRALPMRALPVRALPMRALIVGGGIGGLAAAVALRRVGIESFVVEKAPEIGEVGAGLSLWSNAILAARRLGVEAEVAAAGSAIDQSRSYLPSAAPIDEFDFAAIGRKAGAPTLCVHRADLQRILLDSALARDPEAVRMGGECVGFEEEGGSVSAVLADGSREHGDVLIGADGIHSVVRRSLFGSETTRYAGYFAWRGIAHGASELLPEGQAHLVFGRGAQAGYFHCGRDRIYWYLTCNGAPHSQAGAGGNRAEIVALISNWRVPLRNLVEATGESAILRNDIFDPPSRPVWGRGRVTLLGDAIHAMTPNLGQGACQALEDAVFLADSLRRVASPQAALRDYEARRRARTSFVLEQSRRLGKLFQISNPVGVWLRTAISRTRWARRHSEDLFERLLVIDPPELAS